MKKVLIVLFVLFLGGCMAVSASPQPQVTNDEYEDLIQRISELEEELGNLKRDLQDGLYDVGGE